jgi:hypothetical protein
MGSIIVSAISILASFLAIRWSYRIIYNLWFHPLRNFPGPVLARATKWYETYFDVFKAPGGQYIFEVDRLHQKYGTWTQIMWMLNGVLCLLIVFYMSGPIVRINPDELHINDIDYFDTAYTLNKRRDKDPYHVQIFGTPLSRT